MLTVFNHDFSVKLIPKIVSNDAHKVVEIQICVTKSIVTLDLGI